MTNSCRLFDTEYRRSYVKTKLKPAEKIIERDDFSERIREGEIDPRVASVPARLDEAAEQLVRKRVLDNERSVYQVSYLDPRGRGKSGKEATEMDFGSELLLYVRNLYFDPHEEKVLAPLVTTKRIFGYIRPKLLHGSLSMYQHTFGRTGATIILQEEETKMAPTSKNAEARKHNIDC